MNIKLGRVLMFPEMEAEILKQLQSMTGADGQRFGNRRWVYDDWGEVYIRVTETAIEGKRVPCIIIANVTIEERHRGKGLFKRMCRTVEQYAVSCGRAVVHENIIEQRLVELHRRCGYKPIRSSDMEVPTLYRSAEDLRTNPYDWSSERGIEEIE